MNASFFFGEKRLLNVWKKSVTETFVLICQQQSTLDLPAFLFPNATILPKRSSI